MLFTAFIIVAVQVTVVFGIYLSYGWSTFANSGLHSVFKLLSYNWFSGTYLQYFILVGLLFLVVSLAITLLLFIFSKLSRNYITLVRGVRPFLSNKYDITKHKNYKYLSDKNEKYTFNIEQYIKEQRKPPVPIKPDEEIVMYEIGN